jgi:hypothetical protein
MSRINRLTTERNDLELECMHKDARIASLTAEVERLSVENKNLHSSLEMTLETYNKTVHAGLDMMLRKEPQ